MACRDYRLCDICGAKAFYDARLNYDWPEGSQLDPTWPPFRVAGEAQDGDMRLDHLGDWSVLCVECAKTHQTQIVKRQGGE